MPPSPCPTKMNKTRIFILIAEYNQCRSAHHHVDNAFKKVTTQVRRCRARQKNVETRVFTPDIERCSNHNLRCRSSNSRVSQYFTPGRRGASRMLGRGPTLDHRGIDYAFQCTERHIVLALVLIAHHVKQFSLKNLWHFFFR